jgi:hypothetical protein
MNCESPKGIEANDGLRTGAPPPSAEETAPCPRRRCCAGRGLGHARSSPGGLHRAVDGAGRAYGRRSSIVRGGGEAWIGEEAVDSASVGAATGSERRRTAQRTRRPERVARGRGCLAVGSVVGVAHRWWVSCAKSPRSASHCDLWGSLFTLACSRLQWYTWKCFYNPGYKDPFFEIFENLI